jgi:ubiquinone/menaquinone biosynthesis C-methylase UbiE
MLFNGLWALMLNNRAKKGSQKVLDNLNIRAGDTIADIGSGGGYFAFELAKLAGPGGIVFAADTNEKLLSRIGNIASQSRVSNVKTVICSEDGCPLQRESCDLIFMRNVFHHIKDPVSYFQKLRESIKPGGRIAVLDWKSTEGGFVGRAGHATPEAEVLRIIEQAGFSHLQAFDFLPGQSFHIFRKAPKREKEK